MTDAYSAYANATGYEPIAEDDTDHTMPPEAVSLWRNRRPSKLPTKAKLTMMTWKMPSGVLSTGERR